jgi:uncharacterized protein YbjT (DUF2867 family)
MTAPLGITGSTGLLGGRVARQLSDAGANQRLIVRDASRAPELPGAEIAVASYGDGAASVSALRGIGTLFMVSGSETPDRVRQHLAFIDAAVAAGVERIVYLSFYGAAPDATFTLARDHWATERQLRACGLRYVILRDNLYADFLPQMVGPDGVIRGPAADGRVAAVAQDDIADVLVAVLGDPATHDGATYDLTGPQSLTFDEIAATLSAHRGSPVGYHSESLAEAYASRASYCAPPWQLDAWVSTYTAIAAGELAKVTSDVAELTGHPARSLAALLDRF